MHSARSGVLGAVVALVLTFHAVAQSPVDCQATVIGQNDAAVDAAAVAAAVNSPLATGDVTVCLSGRFDFGLAVPAGNISVPVAPNPTVVALRIVGLDDANGQRATIRNGTQPIGLVRPVPIFSVHNVRFVNPAYSAITMLTAGATVRIAGNHVAGVRSFAPSGQPGLFRNGITVTPVFAPISADVVIEDNVISGGSYTAADASLAVSAGVTLVGALGPSRLPFTGRVTIKNNRFANWSGVGILAIGLNDATIEGNRIDTGSFANAGAGCAQPNGNGSASGISVAGLANSLIRDNVVEVVPSLTAVGTVPPCTAGIIATGVQAADATNNIFYRNRVRGGGTHALVVGATGFGAETDNVFAQNGVANFVPTSATLMLGPAATENVLIGDFPSVQGNAAANDIVTR
jgi:hypothetical protein